MSSKLYQVIDEAQLLLAYAAEQAMELPDDQVEVIVQAKRLKERDNVGQSLEIKFWHAYRVLAEKLESVTVESLKATSDEFGDEILTFRIFKPKEKMSKSRQAVRKYGLWLLISLIALLLTQIYVVFGSTVIHDIDNLSLERENLVREIALLNAQYDTAENTSILLADITQKEDLMLAIPDRLDSNYELLEDWLRIILVFESIGTDEEIQETEQTAETEETAETAETMEIEEIEETLSFGSREESRQWALQMGRISLESISTYFLPLLYGLLGACAYVLRSLAREISRRIYTAQSNIRFQLRMYLGALSGLAVVWVIPGEISIGLGENITRLALAFLAGYSVEIVFAAMDALVGAFSSEKT